MSGIEVARLDELTPNQAKYAMLQSCGYNRWLDQDPDWGTVYPD